MKPRLLFFLTLVLVLVLDQSGKIAVETWMRLHESVTVVPGFFNLTYIHNDGIAFGMFQGNNVLMGAVACVILIVAAWMTRGLAWETVEVNLVGGLLAGGAVGNLIDRVRVGYVIDFFDFHIDRYFSWAAFNVADACISVSVVYILLRLLLAPSPVDDSSSHS